MPRKTLLSKTGQFKKVLGLYRAANRRKFEQAVVEGPQAVRELLSTKPELVRDVYATERALGAHPDISQLLDRLDVYTHLLPPDLFAQLSQDAQGILAVAQIPNEPDIAELLGRAQLLIFALRASDPGNLGTIIRAADAFGAQAVITGEGSVEATNPKVIRSSVGSLFHLPVIESEAPADFITRAKQAGFQVFAADGNADYYLDELVGGSEVASSHESVGSMAALGIVENRVREDLAGRDDGELNTVEIARETQESKADFDLARPTLWIVGNEAHGFAPHERALADAAVAIRMQGRAESLNVAMATSICLYTTAQVQAQAGTCSRILAH